LPHAKGKVDVVGLGFVTNMAEYMAASDVLVTKAGPGTIAEAAAVGLPVFLTRYVGFFKFAGLFDKDLLLTIISLFAVFCQAKRREMSTSS
jgi:hypothetical protein